MTLFSSEPFVNRLCALITRWDASILTAAWLYVESTQDELCALFVDDLPYLDIQQNIVNLEERLLLMPCPTGSSVRKTLMVNPLLVKRLQQNGVFSLRLLTGESTIDPLDIKFSVPFDRRLLRAMFSLHLHQNVPVAEKGLRWLRSPAVIAIFSAWSVETATMYVPLIERMLQRLGVVRELGRETALDIPATRWLLAMGQHDLRVLFLCGYRASCSNSAMFLRQTPHWRHFSQIVALWLPPARQSAVPLCVKFYISVRYATDCKYNATVNWLHCCATRAPSPGHPAMKG